MALSATTYTCHLKVVINGDPTEQEEVPVLVTNDNGSYSMFLNNFVLWMDGFPMPVGNITILTWKASLSMATLPSTTLVTSISPLVTIPSSVLGLVPC